MAGRALQAVAATAATGTEAAEEEFAAAGLAEEKVYVAAAAKAAGPAVPSSCVATSSAEGRGSLKTESSAPTAELFLNGITAAPFFKGVLQLFLRPVLR